MDANSLEQMDSNKSSSSQLTPLVLLPTTVLTLKNWNKLRAEVKMKKVETFYLANILDIIRVPMSKSFTKSTSCFKVTSYFVDLKMVVYTRKVKTIILYMQKFGCLYVYHAVTADPILGIFIHRHD